jgi:DNA polymerase-3 subunit epsilon
MIAKSGEVLYVGKATSLKSRVNSYFRGKAGRDKRKLEMMAQVWDLNVTECKSALEAALMEADEIKKFNPPYNVVMKKGKRHLVFYAEDFSSVSRKQDDKHPIGPFRNTNWIEHLRALASGLFAQVFYEPLPEDQLIRAFRLFCETHGLDPERKYSVRELLAIGLNLYRRHEDLPEEEESEENDEEETEYTDEDVAGKYERLLMRAGHEHWRARLMTKMLNTRVTYMHKGEPRVLDFHNGFRRDGAAPTEEKKPWHDLGVETFDRMSVLLSELEKYEHHIEWTS